MRETLTPTMSSSTRDRLSRERKLLQVKEEKLDIKNYQSMGKHQRGSHYPLCVFTNNPGWRSPEKHAERDKRWRERTSKNVNADFTLRAAVAPLKSFLQDDPHAFLRSCDKLSHDESYCQAGVHDWSKNFDQTPYHNTSACYENCHYNLGDSAWGTSDSHCYQSNQCDGVAWPSASWSIPYQHRPYDDWA